MRGEALFAALGAAAVLTVVVAIAVTLHLLAPSAPLFDAGSAIGFDGLAAATRL